MNRWNTALKNRNSTISIDKSKCMAIGKNEATAKIKIDIQFGLAGVKYIKTETMTRKQTTV